MKVTATIPDTVMTRPLLLTVTSRDDTLSGFSGGYSQLREVEWHRNRAECLYGFVE